MVKIVLKIIFEIIIAVLLFFAIIKRTPLFKDDIINYTPKTTLIKKTEIGFSQTTNSQSGSEDLFFVGKKEEIALFSGIENNNENKVMFASSTYKKYRSCKTPRGDTIDHNQNIVAYQSTTANGNNVCNGQIRICKNGILVGSYKYQNCKFARDGILNGEEIVQGASNNTQQLVKNSGQKPYDLIQPSLDNKKDKRNLFDTEGNKISTLPTYKNNWDNSIKPTIQEFTPTYSNKNCQTPWGEIVKDSSFILAYKESSAGMYETCELEKRACIDGNLLGTFTKPSCEYEYENKDPMIASNQQQDQNQNTLANQEYSNEYENNIDSIIEKIDREQENNKILEQKQTEILQKSEDYGFILSEQKGNESLDQKNTVKNEITTENTNKKSVIDKIGDKFDQAGNRISDKSDQARTRTKKEAKQFGNRVKKVSDKTGNKLDQFGNRVREVF